MDFEEQHIDLDYRQIKTSYYDGHGLFQELYDDLQKRVIVSASLVGVDRIITDLFDDLDTFYRDLVRDEWIYLITNGKCNTEGSRLIARFFNVVENTFITSAMHPSIKEWLVGFQDAQSTPQWQMLAEEMNDCMDSFLTWANELLTFAKSDVNIARMRKYTDFMNSFIGILESNDSPIVPADLIELRSILHKGGSYFHFTTIDLRVITGASKLELAKWVRYQRGIKADTCNDTYDPFTLQPLKQVPFMFLFQHFENGRTYCFDVIELANAMEQYALKANPMTGVIFSESTMNHIRAHRDFVLLLFTTLRKALIK